MRIIFESKNNKLQGQNLLSTTKKEPGMTPFQKNLMRYIFDSPRVKVVDTSMLGNKMAMEVVKRGKDERVHSVQGQTVIA